MQPELQKKTWEMITPHGVITQFPKNGRLFTPKMSWSHHQHLIKPSKFCSHHQKFWSHRPHFVHTVKILFTLSKNLFTPSKFCSHHHNFIHTQKKWNCSHLPNFECVWPSALYLRLLTTPITSHACLQCIALLSVHAPPTEWLWQAPTAPKCQASDALSAGIQAWSHLVYV